MMEDKIVLIDKPAGWTSFDVVAKVRGKIRQSYVEKGEKPTKKQLRVGHAGTLDPFATGLLIVLLGNACKEASSYLKLDKTYQFTAKLGFTSSTGDPEGDLTAVDIEQPPSEEDIVEILKRFKGVIEQTPPAYSAIKVNGQRAYKLAREGKSVAIPSRRVTVQRLKLISYDYPYFKCVCDVSSGTYIRTLVEDLGSALKTGAYCTELRRTRIGNHQLEAASTIDKLNFLP